MNTSDTWMDILCSSPKGYVSLSLSIQDHIDRRGFLSSLPSGLFSISSPISSYFSGGVQ